MIAIVQMPCERPIERLCVAGWAGCGAGAGAGVPYLRMVLHLHTARRFYRF